MISAAFGASVIATARYTVETSKRPVAVAVAHVNARGLGATHIYASKRFEATFGWRAGRAPWSEIRAALRTAHARNSETWVIENLRREPRVMNAEKMNTGYAAIVLVVPESRTRNVARKLVPRTSGAVVLPK